MNRRWSRGPSGPRAIPCSKCRTPITGRDDHLVLIIGSRILSGLDPFCRNCFARLACGGHTKWERTFADGPGSDRCLRTLTNRDLCFVREPCVACRPLASITIDNLDLVIRSIRTAKQGDVLPIYRTYNRLGRCLQWIP